MNDKQRKQIEKWIDSINEIKEGVEFMMDCEEEKYDNMPEGFQESERGERIQEVIEYLGDAESSLEEAIQNLESAKE